jgi:Flp pilus assembly protein TadG
MQGKVLSSQTGVSFKLFLGRLRYFFLPQDVVRWIRRITMRRLLSGSRRPAKRRGFVLVTMALAAVGVFGAVGLAVDVGRMFIAKNELQVYCDSAAVAAALALDGTTAGIARAESDVTASTNKWNFDTASVSGPSVTFATAAAGPWVANPSPATGYTYARVTATVPVKLYFLPLVTGKGTSNVKSAAAAGQVAISSLNRGVGPYTAVSTTPTAQNFGLVVGNSYDIQWPQYNSTRAQCSPSKPDKCFNSPPCTGDTEASAAAVVSNWGASINGYWGSASNSLIASEVLDVIQMAPVAVGTNIQPLLSNGDKAAEAGFLDQRASQDTDTSNNTTNSYLASTNHNGRRLLPVAIVDPVDPTHTNVIGFGQFLLLANGSPSDYYKKTTNGNSPYCALYVGPYNIGSDGSGAGSSTGASAVRLVE